MREWAWAWAWGISGMMSKSQVKSSQLPFYRKNHGTARSLDLVDMKRVSVHVLMRLLLYTEPYHQDPPSPTPPPSAASPSQAAAAVVPPKRAGIMHLMASMAVAPAEAAAATVAATARQEPAHLHAPVAYGTPCSPSTLRLPAAAAAVTATATGMGLIPAQQRPKT